MNMFFIMEVIQWREPIYNVCILWFVRVVSLSMCHYGACYCIHPSMRARRPVVAAELERLIRTLIITSDASDILSLRGPSNRTYQVSSTNAFNPAENFGSGLVVATLVPRCWKIKLSLSSVMNAISSLSRLQETLHITSWCISNPTCLASGTEAH